MHHIEATGLPLGMFCSEQFSVANVQMDAGDTLFLYTDGLSEVRSPAGVEYGIPRLQELLAKTNGDSPKDIIGNCLVELNDYRSLAPLADDLTVMVIRRMH